MAKGQPTAEQTEGKQGGGFGLIGGILLLVATPVVIVLGLIFGLLGGNNTSGATAPQPINVATPTTEVKQLLQTFNIASDEADFLRTNSTALTKYQTTLVTLAQKLNSNDPAYASITTNRATILSLIATMLGQIQTIQTQVGVGANAQTATLASNLLLNAHKLSVLASPDISALALKYAADNVTSNYTKYTYSQANREQFVDTGQGQSDCSSFVSGLLYQSGIISAPISYDTLSLYSTAKYVGRGSFHVIKESTDASGISTADVMATIKPGDILLSGDDTYANGGGTAKNRHTVLYVGNDTVVESTDAGGKHGVQTDSLEDRLKRHTQVIIRGDGE